MRDNDQTIDNWTVMMRQQGSAANSGRSDLQIRPIMSYKRFKSDEPYKPDFKPMEGRD